MGNVRSIAGDNSTPHEGTWHSPEQQGGHTPIPWTPLTALPGARRWRPANQLSEEELHKRLRAHRLRRLRQNGWNAS